MAPREYDSLVNAWASRESRLDARTGTISAILLNVNRGRGGKRYRTEDFIPDYLGKRREPRPKTEEELWDKIGASMKALGGS